MSQRTSRAHRSLVLSLLVSATFHRDPGFKCGVRASISGTPKTAQLYGRTRVRYTVEAMTRSDVQMMLDVKAGDEASFDLLLQKYRTPLVNFLYRMVRDSATAEDLAQEVFLRVYRARKQYSPSAKFTTWMFRIATNLALNSVRDNRQRRMEISMDHSVNAGDEEQPAMEVPDRAPNVEQELVARTLSEMILRAVHAL